MTDSNMSQLWPLFWDAAWETLYIVAITLTLGGFLGLLLGLGLYVTRGGGLYASRSVNLVLNVLVNFFRPIPFVIFIAAVQPLARVVVGTGIGNPAIIFALTLAAAFGISRIVEQNLVTVDPGVIEAARLEIRPGKGVLGEDVVTLGGHHLGDRHRFGQLASVFSEKERQVRFGLCQCRSRHVLGQLKVMFR